MWSRFRSSPWAFWPLTHAADGAVLPGTVGQGHPFIPVGIVDRRDQQDRFVGPVRILPLDVVPDQHQKSLFARHLASVDVALEIDADLPCFSNLVRPRARCAHHQHGQVRAPRSWHPRRSGGPDHSQRPGLQPCPPRPDTDWSLRSPWLRPWSGVPTDRVAVRRGNRLRRAWPARVSAPAALVGFMGRPRAGMLRIMRGVPGGGFRSG